MTLPASGPLAMTDIQTEFGGTNPIGLNEYYAGGGLVPPGTSGTYGAVPSSGALSIQNFYGTSNYIPVYIEELFSTYVYTGNLSTQTITNGIDLAGEGGLVWFKWRSGGNDLISNYLLDSSRPLNRPLRSNADDGQSTFGNSLVLNNNGFTIPDGGSQWNYNPYLYTSWTFRKQPKFFDIVTYTGTGVNRTVAHNLGSVPGCIIVKRTDTAANWAVYHRSIANTQYLVLNSAASAATGATWWNSTTPTDTVFSLGTDTTVNASGGTYVAYIFAHDAGGFGLTGTDNIISCGSFTTDGSGNATVNLGYEPQWALVKSTSFTDSWYLIDVMRGASQTATNTLRANTNSAESAYTSGYFAPTATGFTTPVAGLFTGGQSFIYIAIRRGPMKVPTLGTSVFQPRDPGSAANTVITTGFPVDAQIVPANKDAVHDTYFISRLQGVDTRNSGSAFPYLLTNTTDAEATSTGVTNRWSNTGFTIPSGPFSINPVFYSFGRAPSFFDEVCYTGTGVNLTVLSHNLTAPPELVIIKGRNTPSAPFGTAWPVAADFTATGNRSLSLNTNSSGGGVEILYGTGQPMGAAPTSTTITLGGTPATYNASGATYVAYLFATCPGVSKVGGYTGNGSSQTINCGFAAGSRFILIKRTDSTGDWYVWDSARGINPVNDPRLSLNSTAAEVTTDDSVDTTSTGFVVNQVAATNINVSSGTYIFLAIA